MKKSTKNKRAGKAGKPAKPDYELTYFLDHPQIERHACVGNQDPKPTLGSQINWPGSKSTVSPQPTSQPKTESSKPVSTASSSPSIAQQINFGGKYKK